MIILVAYLIGALMFAPMLWKMSGKAVETNKQTGTVPAGAMSGWLLRFSFLLIMAAVWPLMVLVMIISAFRKAGKAKGEG